MIFIICSRYDTDRIIVQRCNIPTSKMCRTKTEKVNKIYLQRIVIKLQEK